VSDLRVNRVSSLDGSTPVEFATGVTGNAEGLRFEPLIVAYNPTPLEQNLNINTTVFTFTFNQPIEFSGVGTIYIREGSPTGTVFEEFECGVSAGCSIAGETLRLDRQGGNFNGSTNYVITLPNVGIANTYGQYYKGSEGYTFKTSITEFEIQGGDYEFINSDPNSPTGFYKYNLFSSPGIATATAPSASATDLEVMLIGGGGSGGAGISPSPTSYIRDASGGGGAGGIVQFTGPTLNMNAGSWNVTVGSGGTSAQRILASGYSNPFAERQGQQTVLSDPGTTHIAYGGGSGGALAPLGPNNDPTYPDLGLPTNFPSPSDYNWGAPGASGGGGGGNVASAPTWEPGGSGIPGQGNSGATSKNIQYNPNNTPQPGARSVNVGGGGGGAGSPGSVGQAYPTPAPSQPNYYGRHGYGGNGIQVPAFPSLVLAPRVNAPDPSMWNTLGPTNDYYGGGGAGGGNTQNPGQPVASSSLGGYGGGGRSASPWDSGGRPVEPLLQQPDGPQDGAFMTGGGGGGGKVHTTPPSPTILNASRSGAGGPGAVMIRYVHPGAY